MTALRIGVTTSAAMPVYVASLWPANLRLTGLVAELDRAGTSD